MRQKIWRDTAFMYLLLTCLTMAQLFSPTAIIVLSVISAFVLIVHWGKVLFGYKTNEYKAYSMAFSVSVALVVIGVGMGYMQYLAGNLPMYYGLLAAAFVGYVCVGSFYKTLLTLRHINSLCAHDDQPRLKRAAAAFESLDARLRTASTPAGILWRFL